MLFTTWSNMECTQRLENTQDLYSTQTENVDLEQVGFLGICGTKYPVKRGPNKVGRDPSTCSIVLNLNSISRQHAVINVLHGREFMLMDLDSANKTKLRGTSLQPYIPHPLQNGDTVQFGDVFGIFRLLEEEDDLPMTQAIDVPETPIVNKHASRCKPAVIPESPDVSGDDSFVMPSQPFKSNHPFKSPSNKYIKPGGKTISIQPIGGHKIDNVFWNSSKKSASFSLNDSTTSVNDSTTSVMCNQEDGDIHEIKTQDPYQNDSTDSIYNAATQLPLENNQPSMHSFETQLPTDLQHKSEDIDNDMFTANKENINNAETQLFEKKIIKNIFDGDIQIPSGGNSDDIFEAETQNFEGGAVVNNHEKDKSIFDAETQDFETTPVVNNRMEDKNIFEAETQMPDTKINKSRQLQSTNDDIYDAQTQPNKEINESSDIRFSDKSKNRSNLDRSDEIVLFDETDTQDFEESHDSQPIIAAEVIKNDDDDEINLTQTEPKLQDKKVTPAKRSIRIKSDASTDCEDIEISPGQNDPKKVNEDDVTDCEDLFEDEIIKEVKIQTKVTLETNTDIEDLPTQVLKYDIVESPNIVKTSKDTTIKEPDFEDLPTQVLPEDKVEENFEDMATQVLGDDIPVNSLNEAETQQIFSEEIISPFKVPFQTPLKNKKRNSKPIEIKPLPIPEVKVTQVSDHDNDKYYAATQDILNDLCSQKEFSPEPVLVMNKHPKVSKKTDTTIKNYVLDKSLSISDNEEKINTFVNNLTKDEIKEVIGVDSPVDSLKRVPSDPSDIELTPKKLRPFKLMGSDLPNSQEIKLSVSARNKTLATESSSDSEDSQKHDTPLLIKKHKKQKIKSKTKIDLSKKFDSNVLPTRVITRVRKPTSKVIENVNQDTKKKNESILKPKYLTEQDEEPDKDIITENIMRLKSKNDKKSKCNDSVLDKSKKSSPKLSNNHNESAKVDKQEPSISKENLESKIPEASKEHIKKERRKRTTKKSTESDSKNNRESNEGTEKSKRSRRSDKKQVDNDDKIQIDKNDKKHVEKDNNKHAEKDNNKHAEKFNKKHSDNNNKKQSQKSDKNLVVTDEKNVTVIDEETLTKTSNAILSTSNTYTKESHRTRSKNRSKNDKDKTDTSETKRQRGRPRKENNDSTEVEIRRSSRQKVKEELTKSILKKNVSDLNHENSTVYGSINVSSGSDVSPRFGKRSALDLDVPSPKRTRSATSGNSSLRSTPRLRTQYVLFTAFPCEEVKTKLERLGAVIVNDVRLCTVVLTVQVKRTFKLLCAVGLGRPVAGPRWVQACVHSGVLLDPWLHLIKDSVTEQRFKFDLQTTLNGERNFLKGYNVSSTPHVMPSPPEMKLIVECSGGTWKASKPQWICVSCLADKALWRNLKQNGAIIVSSEFILSGVLRQKMDIDANRLN